MIRTPACKAMPGARRVWLHFGLAIAATLACSCAQPVPDETTPVPEAGQFGVDTAKVEVLRPDSSSFPATLYFPVQASKDGVPFRRITYPIPAIAFGHGLLASPDLYRSTLEHLASNGYMVIAIESGGGLHPDHQGFADDLLHALTFMSSQTTDPQSKWFGQVDSNRLAVLGHSMGGGVAILEAADDDRVKAVASLAAAETDPSAVAAAARLKVPSLFIYGTEDSIAPAEKHAMSIYGNAASPKTAIGIVGGCHCGFIDEWLTLCDSGSLTRTDQLSLTWGRLVAFFDLHLLDVPDGQARLLASDSRLIIQTVPTVSSAK